MATLGGGKLDHSFSIDICILRYSQSVQNVRLYFYDTIKLNNENFLLPFSK